MSGSVFIGAAARSNPDILEVLGLTAMMLMFLIGLACLIAALCSFNHFFHARRDSQMKGDEVLGAMSWHGILGFVVMAKETLIAVLSLFIYWKSNQTGRTTFLIGAGLLTSGFLCGWLVGVFEVTAPDSTSGS